MAARPHKLELYLAAVQHPQAEVRFFLETYRHYRGRYPTRLREDFAGTAAVATAWVDFDAAHQAVAVDRDPAAVRWAATRARRLLGEAAGRLAIVCDDVLAVDRPAVDVIVGTNFAVCEWLGRDALLAYLRGCRRRLRGEGVAMFDLYGGPGAMRPGVQSRRGRTERGVGFTYRWEQRQFDHATSRADCRIHFTVAGRRLDDAFVYDWRLWSPAELTDAMREAGFARVDVWCDRFDPGAGVSDGVYRPVASIPPREDFVAYVVGLR